MYGSANGRFTMRQSSWLKSTSVGNLARIEPSSLSHRDLADSTEPAFIACLERSNPWRWRIDRRKTLGVERTSRESLHEVGTLL